MTIFLDAEKTLTKMAALNQTLAIIAWGKDDNGNDDVAVVTGTLVEHGGSYFLDRGSDKSLFRIQHEWLSRICEVQEENKGLLMGADYQLSLSVGNLADDDLVSYTTL